MEDPKDCADMTELRALIDRIDAELVTLLRRRQDCIDRAIVLKRAEKLPARVPARIDDVLAKVRARAAETGLDPETAGAVWTLLIERSIAREEATLGRGVPG